MYILCVYLNLISTLLLLLLYDLVLFCIINKITQLLCALTQNSTIVAAIKCIFHIKHRNASI